VIDAAAFNLAREAVCAAGYEADIEWSEGVLPPDEPGSFAREAIFVICNSGMRFTVAKGIYDRVMDAIGNGQSASTAFGHKGKASAIDHIWQNRGRLFREYQLAQDKLAYLEGLPWIGGITKYHLAKNFGADVAKPDVHLQRLADAEGCSAQELCDRLAKETGLRAATVDVVLWRACAIGALNSRAIASAGRNPQGRDAAERLGAQHEHAVPAQPGDAQPSGNPS
jgi:hypothetical protein